MSQHWRDIGFVPLCTRYLDATANLPEARLDSTRANRTNLLMLVVVIVDNTVTVFAQILAKVLCSLLAQRLK